MIWCNSKTDSESLDERRSNCAGENRSSLSAKSVYALRWNPISEFFVSQNRETVFSRALKQLFQGAFFVSAPEAETEEMVWEAVL